jgi:hypothetical protein
METPMRPCKNTRTKGHWRNRGALLSEDAGKKTSVSKARTRCVITTSKDANPRRPYFESNCQPSLIVAGSLRIAIEILRAVTYVHPFYVITLRAHIVRAPSCHSLFYNMCEVRKLMREKSQSVEVACQASRALSTENLVYGRNATSEY